jgi:hypothetical protein
MDYNIDGVTIPFNDKWNRIAISLSGGADSALLAYLLCTIAKQFNPKISIHVISHVRCWKTKPWQQYDSESVYSWLNKEFDFLKWHRHVNFIAPELEYANTGPSLQDEYDKMVSGDNIQIRSYSEYVCHYHKIDAYYNAVTRNPRNKKFDGSMIERDIEPTETNEHLRIMTHMEKTVIHPFRFVEKNWVISQYKKHNILDLLKITRSCEGTFKDIDYKTYRRGQIVPACGYCFWCMERNWAIDNAS